MYKAMLVDDEILVREAIRDNLKWEELGFELVKVCENGKEAMEFLENGEVDVVITDICMPYADGLEVSRYIYENCRETKVIIFSGYSDFEYAKKAIQYEVADYVLKPVTARELSRVLMAVRKKLDARRKHDRVFEEYSKAYRNYSKNESVIISRTVSNLIKGAEPENISMKTLESHGIAIEGESFSVVIISMDDYAEDGEEAGTKKTDLEIMSFAVENVVAETLEACGKALTYRDSDFQVGALLLMSGEACQGIGRKELCESIRENIEKTLKKRVSVSMGFSVKDCSGLRYAYETARKGLAYRYAKGVSLVYEATSCKEGEGKEAEDCIDRIAEAVLTGKENEVRACFHGMGQIVENTWISREKCIVCLQKLVLRLQEVSEEMGRKVAADEVLFNRITFASDFREGLGAALDFALRVLESIKDLCKKTNELQVEMAIEYMKKNYGDPDLTLGHMCSYLNISTSHFSQIIREATGSTFTELLLDIRMDRAKTLLEKSSLKNYEIAERVGFSDPHYFSVVFKKMTGMTPKEYAKDRGK